MILLAGALCIVTKNETRLVSPRSVGCRTRSCFEHDLVRRAAGRQVEIFEYHRSPLDADGIGAPGYGSSRGRSDV
jgi:hypothetical protein